MNDKNISYEFAGTLAEQISNVFQKWAKANDLPKIVADLVEDAFILGQYEGSKGVSGDDRRVLEVVRDVVNAIGLMSRGLSLAELLAKEAKEEIAKGQSFLHLMERIAELSPDNLSRVEGWLIMNGISTPPEEAQP